MVAVEKLVPSEIDIGQAGQIKVPGAVFSLPIEFLLPAGVIPVSGNQQQYPQNHSRGNGKLDEFEVTLLFFACQCSLHVVCIRVPALLLIVREKYGMSCNRIQPFYRLERKELHS